MYRLSILAAAAMAFCGPVGAQTGDEYRAFELAKRRYEHGKLMYEYVARHDHSEAARRLADDRRAFDAAQQAYEAAQKRDGNWRDPNDAPGWPNDSALRFDYDAAKDFREGPQYRTRKMLMQDQVFRGGDGNFYCKRQDGSTGRVTGMEGVPTGRDTGRLGVPMGAAVDGFLDLWKERPAGLPVVCH